MSNSSPAFQKSNLLLATVSFIAVNLTLVEFAPRASFDTQASRAGFIAVVNFKAIIIFTVITYILKHSTRLLGLPSQHAIIVIRPPRRSWRCAASKCYGRPRYGCRLRRRASLLFHFVPPCTTARRYHATSKYHEHWLIYTCFCSLILIFRLRLRQSQCPEAPFAITLLIVDSLYLLASASLGRLTYSGHCSPLFPMMSFLNAQPVALLCEPAICAHATMTVYESARLRHYTF